MNTKEKYTGLEIAVIGMSCRFPGAKGIDRYWENLKNGRESISFFTDRELEEAYVDRRQLRHPDYVKAMGYLEGIKEFDAAFFNYTPVEAEVMDPQVRLFHEGAWEALEGAGYEPGTYEGLIGLYAGASESFYWKMLAVSSGKIEALGQFELDKFANKDYLCARVAYKLDLKGPVVFVQTACSTSLVAIHMACQGLISGEADIALAGGVSIMQYKAGYIYQEGMIQSPDGHCRAFDERARGTLAGNGLGIVVLKRLEEAEADRDHIYAIIKGSDINNDGMQKIGFTAPSVEQQAEVIHDVLKTAQVEVESIGYIEAHGTGTPLGDPVEIEALRQAFKTDKKGYCGIGSVKSNFGHLDSAAGVAGFIKAALALNHCQIPPSLHFEIPNPKIDFIDSPFYISTALKEWENEPGRYPRRAGVSSLGLGGTNVHVVLEEWPGCRRSMSRRAGETDGQGVNGRHTEGRGGSLCPPLKSRDFQLILLSAKTETALEQMKKNLSAYLEQHLTQVGTPVNPINLADVAYTLQVGRKVFKHRWARVCAGIEETISALTGPGIGNSNGTVRGGNRQRLEELARDWLKGEEIDWGTFYAESGQRPCRIPLPTYPFEGTTYWIEGDPFGVLGEKGRGEKPGKAQPLRKKVDQADWYYIPSWKRAPALPWPLEPPQPGCCLVFTDEKGIGAGLADTLAKLNQEVILVKMGTGYSDTSEYKEVVSKLAGEHKVHPYESPESLCRGGSLCPPTFQIQSFSEVLRQPHNIRSYKEFPREDSFHPTITGSLYTIDPRRGDDYRALFDSLRKTGKVPRKILHLWGLETVEPDGIDGIDPYQRETFEDFQYKGFHSLVYLVRAIGEAPRRGEPIKSFQKSPLIAEGNKSTGSFGSRESMEPMEILVITRDAQKVTGGDLLNPGAAAVLGAVKVIPQENPYLECRAIDVEGRSITGQEAELVGWLAVEYFCETREPMTAYRGSSRWVQSYEPYPMPAPKNPVPRLREQGVYLITGGFGNIGNTLAQYLARTVRAKLVLVNRTGIPGPEEPGGKPVEKPPGGIPGSDPLSDKIMKIRRLEELGGQVLAVKADVADLGQMEAAVARAEAHFGPINGIFHTAGNTGETLVCPLGQVTEQTLRDQFQARVYGLMVLEHLFNKKPGPLDFCLAVSSLVSVLGGLGFAPYTASMMVMDAYVHFYNQKHPGREDRRLGARGARDELSAPNLPDSFHHSSFIIHHSISRPPGPWISVNTAEWQFEEKRAVGPTIFTAAETAALAMTPVEGQETFARVLSHSWESQVVISTADLQARIDKWIKLENLHEGKLSDDQAASAFHPRPGLSTPYVSPGTPFQQALANTWQNFFHFRTIGIRDNFFELGGDSLKVITLVSKIHQEMGVRLSIEEFFRYPTIEGLSGCVERSGEKAGIQGGTRYKSYRAIEPMEKKEYYPLSSAQERLYLIQQVNPESTGYNIPLVIPLGKEIDINRLETVLKRLIARHESLRTSFIMVGNEPVQRVQEAASAAQEEQNYKLQNTNGPSLGSLICEPIIKPCQRNSNFHTESDQDPKSQELRAKSYIRDFIRPFDLSRAPLIRSGIIEHPDHRYTWMVDMHHIISDGISQVILLEDFLELYETGSEALEPLRLQYKDFSAWQNRLFSRGEIKPQEEYWLNLYADAKEIPHPELPMDFKRPGVFTFTGEHYEFKLEKEEVGRFKETVTGSGGTLFMGLLAVLNILFYKYTGQGDIVIGCGAAGRSHIDLQRIMGMFVNTLPIRNQPQADQTWEEFLKEVIHQSLRAFANQEYQFEELVGRLKLERDPSRNPLFDICMVLQNFGPAKRRKGNLLTIDGNYAAIGYKNSVSRFDISFFLQEAAEEVNIDIEYYTGIYREETLRRMVSHFKQVFKIIIDEPRVRLKEIEIITGEEKRQIVEDFNKTAVEYPRDRGIHELYEEAADREPDRLAVVYEEAGLTYGELNKKSGQLATYLHQLGVGPGAMVGIMMERSLEMMIGILGILKAGGAYMPINPGYPGERNQYMLKDSGTKALLSEMGNFNCQLSIVNCQLSTMFSGGTGQSPVPKNPFIGSPRRGPTSHQPSATSLAYIMYTSGTTGKPKGVLVEHRNVVRLVKNTDYIEWDKRDRLLQTGVLEFDASTFEVWGALLNGLALVLVETGKIVTPHRLKEVVKQYDIVVMSMTSPLYNQVVTADIEIFAGLKYLVVGGDVVSAHHINCLKLGNPAVKIIHAYGPTENTTFSTTYRIDHPVGEDIPIGKPIANSTAYIVGFHGHMQPIGVVGELWVGGDGLARGYLNKPELTAERFVISHLSLVIGKKSLVNSHWSLMNNSSSQLFPSSKKHSPNDRCPMTNDRLYKTGDIARWCPDGNIIFQGRMDRQVKIRGYRVELGEIENHLNSHPRVRESVVVALEAGEKYLCAYVVTEEKIETAELRDFLAGRLPGFMVPGFFVPLEKIPLTTNGKVDRRALPAPGQEVGRRYTAPRDDLEKRLVRIYSEVLGSEAMPASSLEENLGIDDNFFERGGHSLKAVWLISKIHRELGAKIALAEVFKAQTPRELGRIIRGSSRETYAPIEPVPGKEYYELSFNQKRLWILQQANPGGNAYNLSGIIVMRQGVKEELVERTVEKILERHESLRTGFKEVDARVVQYIMARAPVASSVLEIRDISLGAASHDGVPLLEDNEISQKLLQGVQAPRRGVPIRMVRCVDEISAMENTLSLIGRPCHALFSKRVPLDAGGKKSNFNADEDEKQALLREMIREFDLRPFSLEAPPLFRALLVKVEAELSILACCMHHIVSDGWSMEILERDFHTIYKALLENRGIEPPGARITYKDFAQWHNRRLEEDQGIRGSREYWKRFLQEGLPGFRLPGDIDDAPAAGRNRQRGAAYRMVIPAEVKDSLKRLSQEHRVTLFSLMFSVYTVFLSVVTGQGTVVCSIVNAGREHPDLREVIGFFVNSVIFKIGIKEEQEYLEYAREVQRSVLESFAHQHYPLELVLDEVGKVYPEVSVSFNMLNISSKEAEFLEDTEDRHIPEIQDVKFDLESYLVEYGNGIDVVVNYDRDRYKAENIRYMMEKYRKMLEFFVLHPHKQIKDYKEQKRKSFKRGTDHFSHLAVKKHEEKG